MELFIIYLITRLTDFKSALTCLSIVMGILTAMALAIRLFNEFCTTYSIKDRAAKNIENKETFVYLGVKRSSTRGLWWFTPVFVLVFSLNIILPTTRDALVIAGGYGLTEAVKNEKVQKLFTKSAQVASSWLERQLKDDDKAAPSNQSSSGMTKEEASAGKTSSEK